jgi:hypothetical protein
MPRPQKRGTGYRYTVWAMCLWWLVTKATVCISLPRRKYRGEITETNLAEFLDVMFEVKRPHL